MAESHDIWNDGWRIFAITMPTQQEIARACATLLVAADFVIGDRGASIYPPSIARGHTLVVTVMPTTPRAVSDDVNTYGANADTLPIASQIAM